MDAPAFSSLDHRPCLVLALALEVAASVTGAERAALRGAGRGSPGVARARQLAIYLAHVALGGGRRRIAAALDRRCSTIRWACRAVEARRDGAAFDLAVTMIERGCVRLLAELHGRP